MNGNGQFEINNEELIAASSDYVTASDEYDKAVTSLNTELDKIQDYWQDSMSNELAALVEPAIKNLNNEKENLSNSGKMFNEICETAKEFTSKMKTEIKNLDLK